MILNFGRDSLLDKTSMGNVSAWVKITNGAVQYRVAWVMISLLESYFSLTMDPLLKLLIALLMLGLYAIYNNYK